MLFNNSHLKSSPLVYDSAGEKEKTKDSLRHMPIKNEGGKTVYNKSRICFFCLTIKKIFKVIQLKILKIFLFFFSFLVVLFPIVQKEILDVRARN